MDDAERLRQGMTVRREVLGDEHVDRAVAARTDRVTRLRSARERPGRDQTSPHA